MWKIPRLTLLTIGLALACYGVAQAHHGWSSYDATKKMTIEGPIKQSKFGYPHASIVMAHEGKDWTIILAPPSRMTARGATEEVVAEGKTISATGYPKSSGEPEIRAEYITADGKQIQLR